MLDDTYQKFSRHGLPVAHYGLWINPRTKIQAAYIDRCIEAITRPLGSTPAAKDNLIVDIHERSSWPTAYMTYMDIILRAAEPAYIAPRITAACGTCTNAVRCCTEAYPIICPKCRAIEGTPYKVPSACLLLLNEAYHTRFCGWCDGVQVGKPRIVRIRTPKNLRRIRSITKPRKNARRWPFDQQTSRRLRKSLEERAAHKRKPHDNYYHARNHTKR